MNYLEIFTKFVTRMLNMFRPNETCLLYANNIELKLWLNNVLKHKNCLQIIQNTKIIAKDPTAYVLVDVTCVKQNKAQFINNIINNIYYETNALFIFEKLNDLQVKFDYIIENPPYNGNIHLNFFELGLNCLNKNGKLFIVEPAMWLIQLKKNGTYTKENSQAVRIKHKIESHVESVNLQNLNREFNTQMHCLFSITTVDFGKVYSHIKFTCVTDKTYVKTIYDCNHIGKYDIIQSILNKCALYKDHMKNHITNDILLENNTNYFISFATAFLSNLGTMKTHSFTNAFTAKTSINETLSTYYDVGATRNSISQNITRSKKGQPCDSIYGTLEELENWVYFIYNNKLAFFINACLTVDRHNNSTAYLPWIVDNKYTDEEIYIMFNFTKEEIELIEYTCKKFDRFHNWGKNYFKVDI